MNLARLSSLSAAAALIVAGVTVYVATDRHGKRCDDCDLYKPDASHSAGYNAAMVYLRNDLTRRADWTADDCARLRETIAVGIPMARPEPGSPAIEGYAEADSTYGLAMATISEKLRRSKRLSPEVRASLATLLADQLASENPRMRLSATANVVYARLPTDPDVRSRLERMADSETDPPVTQNIRRQLSHFDEVERLKIAGKYSEPPPFNRPER